MAERRTSIATGELSELRQRLEGAQQAKDATTLTNGVSSLNGKASGNNEYVANSNGKSIEGLAYRSVFKLDKYYFRNLYEDVLSYVFYFTICF